MFILKTFLGGPCLFQEQHMLCIDINYCYSEQLGCKRFAAHVLACIMSVLRMSNYCPCCAWMSIGCRGKALLWWQLGCGTYTISNHNYVFTVGCCTSLRKMDRGCCPPNSYLYYLFLFKHMSCSFFPQKISQLCYRLYSYYTVLLVTIKKRSWI